MDKETITITKKEYDNLTCTKRLLDLALEILDNRVGVTDIEKDSWKLDLDKVVGFQWRQSNG